jgi:hypothetical protein
LGAERLLTALTQLDQNKLQKDRRHLQLSKTISLARLMPTELIELRQTGKITFNTLMDWFDRDFPGHYLRLIKCVRVTVLALVPPIDGIHAMLTNSGTSSVVVNESGAFVKKRALRSYGEAIALDAAYNETGLFVLDYNDPMFLPFEALGVETEWTFELPRATNRFNFDTIADVLFTIEYTALHSDEYARQVRERLGERTTAGTLLDLRMNFPDQWYHLKNPQRKPDGSVDAQKVTLNLPASLFPPNLSELRVLHVTMMVVGDLKGGDPSETALLRQALSGGIALSKDGEPLGLAPLQFKDRYAVFSTPTAGAVVREFWRNVPGVEVSSIPLTTPSADFEVLNRLEGSPDQGTDYGSRIRGYLRPAATGAYTFWIASDDSGELHLSTDQDPANLRRIAYLSGRALLRQWDKTPSQKSQPVTLEANKEYCFEVLQKQGSGGDHVEVGWLKPGESGTVPSEVIPGSCLSFFSRALASNTSPPGEWSLHLGRELYDTGQGARKSVVDRMESISLVLTVEGTVQWTP